MTFKIFETLNSSVLQVASFFRVEVLPSPVVEVVEKLKYKEVVHEVDEGVPNIGVILIVDGQVEEIVLSLVVFVDLRQDHLLVVLVRNVPYHYRSACVITPLYFFKVYVKEGLVEGV